jgi:zinc protease
VWVVLTGAIDEKRAAKRLAATLRWEVSPRPAARAMAAPGSGGEARREVRTGAADQAHLYLGHLTVPRSHPDALALEVLSVILGAGAGLSGRIPNRVREVEGLAYAATASALSGAGSVPGRLAAYVGTSPKTVEKAERAVREELERLVEGGVSDLEVEEAKGFLLGREPFRRETARQWGDLVAESRIYGQPYDDAAWVEAGLRSIDRAQIEAAIQRHVRPEDLRVTVGLPGKKSRKRPALA